ncbi:uncharacterized protein BYT42DRAFT_569957 [Radiomyces spectabilis]|uniref:uncharacterized protein n=1 Tax=Radiomyces spectabilis TaxID=64574 RepID=UPI00221EF823|nr:uncharacterized protein BYT42DRAFT_569957 [Radiomyces spectabilis]KAI8379768.1 hypothetical protein BYT42DRAFT_569957 [Radiomyces spectabilis]
MLKPTKIFSLFQLRYEKNHRNLEVVIHRLWRTFIALGAPLELNITNREEIGAAIQAHKWDIVSNQCALDIFHDAELQVRAILEQKVAEFDAMCLKSLLDPSYPRQNQKRVAIIGGGFTGFTIASILDPMPRFHVTLIDTKDSFEYSPGMIKMLVRPEETSSLRVRHGSYVKNGRVIIGYAEKIVNDATAVKVNDELIPFDYLVIATGSTYKSKLKSFDVSALYRMSDLAAEHIELKKANSVLIIGGGLVGCELASEIALHTFSAPYRQKKRVTLVESHSTLVRRSSDKRRINAYEYLTKLGVEVVCNEKIVDFDSCDMNTYLGSSGRTYRGYDKVYLATGTTPSSQLLQGDGDVGFEACVDHWSRIRVKPTLQLDHWKYKHIFAGGDVTNINEEKTGYAATLAGVCIARNICRMEKGKQPLRQGTKGTISAPVKPLHGQSSQGGIGRQQLGNLKRTFAFLNPNWAALKVFDEQQFLRIVQGEAVASTLAVGRLPSRLDVTSKPRGRSMSRDQGQAMNRRDFFSQPSPAANMSGSDILSSSQISGSGGGAESVRSYLFSHKPYNIELSFEPIAENCNFRRNEQGHQSMEHLSCSSEDDTPTQNSDSPNSSIITIPDTHAKPLRHMGSTSSMVDKAIMSEYRRRKGVA